MLPTYNEADNIIQALDNILSQNAHSQQCVIDVLVVDDSSPDNTAGIVRKYQQTHSQVHLLLRTEKQGLGAAYIAGMIYALETFDPDVIIEIDADGQHNPTDIPRLLQEITQGADFVIGSRYVKQGRMPDEWKTSRRLLSKAANAYTRVILRTGGAKDCTGGFRAIRAEILRRIDLSKLAVQGYAFQVVLLDAAVRAGATVVEVPIIFGTRTHGESKMRASDLIKGGASLAQIRVKQLLGTHQTIVDDTREVEA